MTAFAIFKLLCAVLAMVAGAWWVWRRIVPVASEESSQAFQFLRRWDAVMTGVAVFAFGLALLLDALGVVVWIGEW